MVSTSCPLQSSTTTSVARRVLCFLALAGAVWAQDIRVPVAGCGQGQPGCIIESVARALSACEDAAFRRCKKSTDQRACLRDLGNRPTGICECAKAEGSYTCSSPEIYPCPKVAGNYYKCPPINHETRSSFFGNTSDKGDTWEQEIRVPIDAPPPCAARSTFPSNLSGSISDPCINAFLKASDACEKLALARCREEVAAGLPRRPEVCTYGNLSPCRLDHGAFVAGDHAALPPSLGNTSDKGDPKAQDIRVPIAYPYSSDEFMKAYSACEKAAFARCREDKAAGLPRKAEFCGRAGIGPCALDGHGAFVTGITFTDP